MIREGGKVFILPTHSLRFGGRWGNVVDIEPHLEMPLKVKFPNSEQTFYFDRNEVLSPVDYYAWFSIDTNYINVNTGEIVKPQIKAYPHIIDTNGEKHVFTHLMPITYCDDCGKENTGEFSNLCEECKYPIPQE